MTDRKLTGREVVIVRHLARFCGAGGVIVLPRAWREAAAGLWRLALVEVWYRQSLTSGNEGPFYRLTDRGLRLAATLFTDQKDRAPRVPWRQRAMQPQTQETTYVPSR